MGNGAGFLYCRFFSQPGEGVFDIFLTIPACFGETEIVFYSLLEHIMKQFQGLSERKFVFLLLLK